MEDLPELSALKRFEQMNKPHQYVVPQRFHPLYYGLIFLMTAVVAVMTLVVVRQWCLQIK